MLSFLKNVRIWLLNPKTLLPDTMLSFAVYGFVFSLFFMLLALIIANHKNNPDYLKYVAEIVATIYPATIGAYAFNAHSKRVNSSTQSTEEPKD